MNFTQEQKDKYLDRLALATQEGIWLTEMALLKDEEKLAKKKALLTILEQQLENKEFKNARDGKNQIKHVTDEIADLENEVQGEKITIETGHKDLEMIEEYRQKPV